MIAVPAHAHHSFSAHYLEDQRVSIEGELVRFESKSPHAWVHVRVRDSQGETRLFPLPGPNANPRSRSSA